MQLKLPIGETAVSSVWDFGFMYVKLLFSLRETLVFLT